MYLLKTVFPYSKPSQCKIKHSSENKVELLLNCYRYKINGRCDLVDIQSYIYLMPFNLN